MNLDYLYYFKTLAETQHYSEAADKLGISQPNLSYAINALEKELGYRLFDKAGRNIRLNEYGKLYYECISEALLKIEEGHERLDRFRYNTHRTVTIGITSVISSRSLLPMLLLKYQEAHKEDPVYFSTVQLQSTEEVINDVQAGKLDLGICLGAETNGGIRQRFFLSRPVCAVIPEGHPLWDKKEIRMADIAACPMILGNASGRISRAIDFYLNINSIPFPEITHLNKPQECMAAAIFQKRLTILAYASYYRDFPVRLKKIGDFPLEMNYYVTERSDTPETALTHSVFGFLAENSKENIWEDQV